jgi:glycoside/pentoside/hexuronide:cation symporter, GPH family
MIGAPPLSTSARMSYGAGAIANGIKGTAFNAYLLLFYNQVLGVSATVVAMAIMATLISDAIADPIVGRVSDFTRSKLGRRHPYIYGAIIPTTLFFTLAWFPPSGLGDLQMGLWVFATAALARISFAFFEIPTSAMTADLTDDYAERTKLFSLRYWFGYVGAYGFFAISLVTFFAATPEYPRGQLNPEAYVGFAIAAGATIFITMLICGLGTQSRIPWMTQAGSKTVPISLFAHFKDMMAAFRHRAFLAIFGFGVCKYSAIGVYAAINLYFQTYLWELVPHQLALLTFSHLIAACIALPIAPIATRMFGKRNSSMIFALTGVTLGLSPLVLRYFGLFVPVGSPALLPTLFVIDAVYGALVAVSLINTASMLADVVEDSAVSTGQHSAGTFFAASSFMQKCSGGIGIAIAGLVLTWSKFPEKADPSSVTEVMLDSLLMHYIPIVALLWGTGIAILTLYPLTQAKHEENVATLRKRAADQISADGEAAVLPA